MRPLRGANIGCADVLGFAFGMTGWFWPFPRSSHRAAVTATKVAQGGACWRQRTEYDGHSFKISGSKPAVR
jgi:hypothetical protein